jgi:hypothetical protein
MDTATPPAQQFDRTREDASNIVALEHVNVQIADQQLATAFYVTGLQLTRDPYLMVGLENMWINAGRTQFHLPTAPAHVQRLRGVIGLAVPKLGPVETSLKRASQFLRGTQFSYRVNGDSIEATCPWGNRFRLHEPDSARWGQTELGIVYLELDVPVGTACAIANFYLALLDAPTDVDVNANGAKYASVRVGADQCLRFIETSAPIAPYDGHHIQIYVSDFSGPHWRLLELGLVSRESDAHEWRFIDVVDPDTNKVVYQLEHEVRSVRHPLYERPKVNRNPAQTNREYLKGQDSFRGSY